MPVQAAQRQLSDPSEFFCTDNRRLPTGFGGECDFKLAEDKEYLPSRAYLEAVTRTPSRVWSKEAESMLRAFRKLQNPADCAAPESVDKGRWHLVKLIQAGIGFNVYIFSLVVERHFEYGVPTMVNINNRWRFSDMRCGRGYTCHLKNLTRCKFQDIPGDRLVAITHHGPPWPTVSNVCGAHGKFIWSRGRCLCDPEYRPYESGTDEESCRRPVNNRDKIPSKIEALEGNSPWSLAAPGETDMGGSGCPYQFPVVHKQRHERGYFWWHSVFLREMITGADNYAALRDWGKNKGLVDNQCIAVHVRHGDACMDHYSLHRTCHPWSEYAEKIKLLEGRYGTIPYVFLATDDDKVIADAEEMFSGDTEHTVVHQNMSRAKYKPKGWGDTIDVREDLNKPEVVTEFMQDVIGLSLCDYFVGTFSSSVGWMVVELQAASHGHFRPFIALDMPYAHKKNVGRFQSWDGAPSPESVNPNT